MPEQAWDFQYYKFKIANRLSLQNIGTVLELLRKTDLVKLITQTVFVRLNTVACTTKLRRCLHSVVLQTKVGKIGRIFGVGSPLYAINSLCCSC